MYRITKSGEQLSLEDWPRWCKREVNGVFILCPESEATHIVVSNDYIESLEDVAVEDYTNEYIRILGEKNAEMEEQLTSAQLALVELYELIGG